MVRFLSGKKLPLIEAMEKASIISRRCRFGWRRDEDKIITAPQTISTKMYRGNLNLSNRFGGYKVDIKKESLRLHEQWKGKIEVVEYCSCWQ